MKAPLVVISRDVQLDHINFNQVWVRRQHFQLSFHKIGIMSTVEKLPN
jgi:hypothetical protein